MDYNDIPPAEMVNPPSSSSDSESESSENDIGSDSDDEMNVGTNELKENHSSTLPIDIYVFRPYTLMKLDYKLHKRASEYPTARSGHRVIATESNLYSLGGYNPRTALTAARRGLCLLFQELWCFNFATNKWKLHMSPNLGEMPRELASVALALHNNILIVSIFFMLFIIRT